MRVPAALRISGPWGVIGVVAVAVLVVVSQIFVSIPLTAGIAEEYRATLQAVSWVGGGFGLTFALGNLLFPALSDHVDPRLVMCAGLLAVGAAGVVAGSSRSLAVLVGARCVQGFCASAVAPVSLAYLPKTLPERFRPTGIAVLSCTYLSAAIVGQAYALVLEAVVGWRAVLVWQIPVFIVVAAAVLLLPAAPDFGAAASVWRAIGRVPGMFARPPLLVAYSGALVFLLVFVGMYAALQNAVAELGVQGAAVGLLLRLPGLPGIVLALFAGMLVRRWGAHRAGGLAFLTSAIGLALEAFGEPLWLVLVGSGVFVAGVAVAGAAAVTVVATASGAARGAGVSGYAFLIGVGACLAPLLAGWLAGAGFARTMLVLAAITLVPAVAFAFGPRPEPDTA